MQRFGFAYTSRSAGLAAGLAGSSSTLRSGVARAPQAPPQAPPNESIFVEEGSDGWDVVWQPVTRREVRQALDEVATLSRSRNAALPPLGTVYLEDITSDNGSSTASDGDEADVAMMFAETGLPGEGASVPSLEDSMVGILTGLLNDPMVFASIQTALERDVHFQRLMASGPGSIPVVSPPARLALQGRPSTEPVPDVSFKSVLEALATGITEAAVMVQEAFAGIAQMLRSIGDAIRLALYPDGSSPATHGAPGSRSRDPRVMVAVSKLALAIAVFVMFRRVAPGMLMRV